MRKIRKTSQVYQFADLHVIISSLNSFGILVSKYKRRQRLLSFDYLPFGNLIWVVIDPTLNSNGYFGRLIHLVNSSWFKDFN